MSRWRWTVVAAATTVAFWPTWSWYLARLRDGADEKLGLVAVLAVAALAIVRRSGPQRAPSPVLLAGLAVLHAALVLLDAPALVRAIPALLAVASITSAAAYGRRLHPGSAALLLLGLPLESTLQFFLGYPLRIVATRMASGLLTLGGLEVGAAGTLLHFRGEAIGVDAPCSGIHMLWVGLLAACAMAALRDLDALRTALAGLFAVGAVVLANGVRVAVLFVKEAHIVALPDWTHEALGAAIFAGAMLVVLEGLRTLATDSAEAPQAAPSSRPRWLAAYAAIAVLCAAAPLAPAQKRAEARSGFPGWPASLDGVPLAPLPATPGDARFASGFPGRFARFTDGRRAILLRWLATPTRRLHSAADCFRGAGFRAEPRPTRVDARGQRWGCFLATRQDASQTVCERIFDETGASWTDASSWWWAAALGRTRGPYWAVTVVES